MSEPLTLFLVGYRGSGKSTVGRLLARGLGADFVDTDELIVDTFGRSIAEIFATDGEPAFRTLESQVLQDLTERDEAETALVVATGGGVVLSYDNRKAMKDAGTVVWMRGSAETLQARIASDDGAERPALQGSSAVDEVAEVLKEREALYDAAADVVVDTDDLSLDEVARRALVGVRSAADGRNL